MNINIKIISYRDSQRYVVKRAVIAAYEELRRIYPELQVTISGIHERMEMEKYTAVMILPSLVVNEKLVCVGRFPKKGEIIFWLEEAIKDFI
jgi:hypothetical protein